MTFNPLEMLGAACAAYLMTSSLQQVLYRYGYARGREEALKDAAKAASKEVAQ